MCRFNKNVHYLNFKNEIKRNIFSNKKTKSLMVTSTKHISSKKSLNSTYRKISKISGKQVFVNTLRMSKGIND